MTATERAGHRRSSPSFSEYFCQPLLKASLLCVLLLVGSAPIAYSQGFPKEIRGYKVHRANILLKTSINVTEHPAATEASVRIGDPALVDVGLTGLTFEISAEIDPLNQSGKVDFLSFHDFRINGLAVDIEEYRERFSFKKNQPVTLPKPAKVCITTDNALRAGWKEFDEKKDEWAVTGRIFVFGKFRKMGFDFKRVIPVDVSLTIRNPLL